MSIPIQEKAAARAALRAINRRSITENVEYGVVIYRHGGHYGLTPSFTSGLPDGLAEPDIEAALRRCPPGTTPVALAHTHAAAMAGLHSTHFSREDIAFADKRRLNGYLATPQGDLVMYDCKGMPGIFPRERL